MIGVSGATGSNAEIVHLLTRHARKAVDDVDMPQTAFESALRGGLPPFIADVISKIYGEGFYREGKGGVVNGTTHKSLGRAPRWFEDPIAENVEALR